MTGSHWTTQRERASEKGMAFLVGVMRLTGPGFVRVLVIPVALYYYLTSPNARRTSSDYRRHLVSWADVNGKALGWLGFFGYRHILSFAQAMVDRVYAWTTGAKGVRYQISDRLLLDQTLSDQSGGAIIFVTHLGNFDLAIARSEVSPNKKFNIVMDMGRTRVFNRFRDKIFDSDQVRFIAPNALDPVESMGLVQRVAEGEVVIIAADRTSDSEGRNSVPAKFLGDTARFPIGPWVLAHILEAPVYLLFAHMKKGVCHLQFEQFATRVTVPRADRMATLTNYAQQLATRLERECLRVPFQWYNFYDFWQPQRSENSKQQSPRTPAKTSRD